MNAGSPADQTIDHDPAPSRAEYRGRLWTPWRMGYVSGGVRSTACIFCHYIASTDDVRNLILHRGQHAIVIMNLYPYNTGHLLLIPNHHVGSPEQADDAAMIEMAQLRGPMLRALRRSLSCQAFNLGLNVGTEAGAGLAEHLHEHIVPRWIGDANFMPIFADTIVLPELLAVTYAKVRAEAVRELNGELAGTAVVFDSPRSVTLVDRDGRAPRFVSEPGSAVWRTAQHAIQPLIGIDPLLTGWAGSTSARDSTVGLTFVATHSVTELPSVANDWRWLAVREALAGPDGPRIAAARLNVRTVSSDARI